MVRRMAESGVNGVRIGGVVTCVPANEVRLGDAPELFGGNAAQIARLKRTIGLDRRRVVGPGTTAADLCEAAARRLLEGAAVPPGEVDAVVCVTQMPDYPQPCNAAVLHGRLGLPKKAAAFDVNLGCSGYVYGLWLAHLMAASGGCGRVLLLAGDATSRLTHPRDRTVAPLFGDGGSATLVEADAAAGRAFFALGTDGSGYDQLIVPAGGARRPTSPETAAETTDAEGNPRTEENLRMDGAGIFNFSITEEPRAVRGLLDYAGISADAVDAFVFHQANRYILTNIAKRLKLPVEKVPMRTVERFGNQSSASIPCALCGELAEALRAGERRLLLSGFGVGLSWASAILSAGPLPVCEIIERPDEGE